VKFLSGAGNTKKAANGLVKRTNQARKDAETVYNSGGNRTQ